MPKAPTFQQAALLFLAVLFFHALGSWSLPLIDRDEPRFAEASREMRARGDYIVPYFNGAYRFDKPPLIYWLQSSAYAAFGENEFAARLPSMLAAAGVAVLLLFWGARMFDPATGLRAAILFSLCLQVVVHAKASVADMAMVFFFTSAMWSGWEMRRAGTSGGLNSRWWWIFYGSLGLGFLAKGPIAWLPLIPFFRLPEEEGRRKWLPALAGLLFMLLLVAAWGIPALRATHGEYFKIGIGKHVVERSVGNLDGHGSSSLRGYVATLPLYLFTIWISFAPWSFRLPALLQKMRLLWRERDAHYLAAAAVLVFIVFTLIKTKLPHYTLPAFPLLALLLARDLEPRLFRRAAALTAGFWLIVTLGLFPLVARQFLAPALLRQSRAVLRPEMEFASSGYEEPSLVWSFRKELRTFYTRNVSLKKAARFMAKKGPRFYIVPTADLATAFPQIEPGWKIFRQQGWNLVNGRRLDLSMVVKTE